MRINASQNREHILTTEGRKNNQTLSALSKKIWNFIKPVFCCGGRSKDFNTDPAYIFSTPVRVQTDSLHTEPINLNRMKKVIHLPYASTSTNPQPETSTVNEEKESWDVLSPMKLGQQRTISFEHPVHENIDTLIPLIKKLLPKSWSISADKIQSYVITRNNQYSSFQKQTEYLVSIHELSEEIDELKTKISETDEASDTFTELSNILKKKKFDRIKQCSLHASLQRQTHNEAIKNNVDPQAKILNIEYINDCYACTQKVKKDWIMLIMLAPHFSTRPFANFFSTLTHELIHCAQYENSKTDLQHKNSSPKTREYLWEGHATYCQEKFNKQAMKQLHLKESAFISVTCKPTTYQTGFQIFSHLATTEDNFDHVVDSLFNQPDLAKVLFGEIQSSDVNQTVLNEFEKNLLPRLQATQEKFAAELQPKDTIEQ